MTTRNKLGYAILVLLLLGCIGIVALALPMTALVLLGLVIFYGLFFFALSLISGDK